MKTVFKSICKLPMGVVMLGIVSMFSNAASVIVSTFSPTLVIDILHEDVSVLGNVRGITEGFAYIVKLFTGFISDYVGKRKPIVLCGYFLSILVKPIFATAHSIVAYATAQALDRTTNGLRDAPRDAMIADIAPKEYRGLAFGLRQALSAVGSTVGAFAIYLLLTYLSSSGTGKIELVRSAYWFTIVPLSVCVLVLMFFVKDPTSNTKLKDRKGFPIKKADLKEFDIHYWFFIFIAFIFMCSRSSEVFLVNRAKELGLSVQYHTLVLLTTYFASGISAYLMGIVADKISRKICLLIGFLCLLVSYIMFAVYDDLTSNFISLFIYGWHFGTVQIVLFAMLTDFTPKHLKGTSFGVLSFVTAIGMIVASSLQGHVWDKFGAEVSYIVLSAILIVSIVLLLFLRVPSKDKLK